MKPLRIDVVSDFVCPWCFIGKRRLELALQAFPEVEPVWSFRPYLLDPATPSEGADLRERLQRKYGDPEPLFRRVETAARENGLALDFSKVQKSVPTVRAHTLSRNALAKGTQRDLVEALFSAYFLEGRDISSTDVLLELGARAGFARDEVLAMLESPTQAAEIRREAQAAAAGGVSGVPFTVLAERFAVSGAQAPEVFKKAIERALEA